MTTLEKSPRFPLRLVLVAAAVTLCLALWNSRGRAERAHVAASVGSRIEAVEVSTGAAPVLHLDEVLTMSARWQRPRAIRFGSTATGNSNRSWIALSRGPRPCRPRSGGSAPPARRTRPTGSAGEDGGRGVRMDPPREEEEALASLTGPEYERQKQIYAAGMDAFIKEIEAHQHNAASEERRASLLQNRSGRHCDTVAGAMVFRPVEVSVAWRRKANSNRGPGRLAAGKRAASPRLVRVLAGRLDDAWAAGLEIHVGQPGHGGDVWRPGRGGIHRDGALGIVPPSSSPTASRRARKPGR